MLTQKPLTTDGVELRRRSKAMYADSKTAPQNSHAIEVARLAKSFGSVQAVDNTSFAVAPGEVFGFLGPNGAGKTTTINMLTGLARPDSGSVCIGGIDTSRHPKAAQHLMGVVPDESNLYPELTGFENLCFCGALYGMRRREREGRAGELIRQFDLTAAAARRFGTYSKGMRRKLTIAAGIIHSPPILFLDEPTSGIDVASARQIRRLIQDLNAGGMTVFLTTHYIEEAERLCHRVAFIVTGRVAQVDTVERLMQQNQQHYVVQFELGGALRSACSEITRAFPYVTARFVSDTGLRIESAQELSIGPLVRFLENQGAAIFEARRVRPSLEEVFVRITGIEAGRMRENNADNAKMRAAG